MIQANADRLSWLPSLALVVPLLVPMGLAAYVAGGWVSGQSPFWTAPELSLSEAVIVRRFGWPGTREQIRTIAAMIALDVLRRTLEGRPVEEPHELGKRR